jgi:hypothetical protein
MRLFRAALNSPSVVPSFLTHRRVDFARHPANGKWNVFYLAGERELQSSRILQTAPVDPRTGDLLSPPVKLTQGLSSPPAPAYYGRFSVGGGGVMAWALNTGSLPIWRLNWADLDGNLLAKVAENRNYISLALSPDESKIAAEVADPDAHIWILDSKTGVGDRISNAPDPETSALWAHDGKSVFYVSSNPSGREIKRHFLDNSTPPELIWKSGSEDRILSNFYLSGVSPEGRYLLVQTGLNSLSRLDLQAAPPRKLEPLTQGRGLSTLSLDGRALAWGTFSGGGLAVQAYPLTSEPPNRFKGKAGQFINHPFFSADGRILYADVDKNLLAFPISRDRGFGEPKLIRPWITSQRGGSTTGAASRDGKRLLLLETDQTEILNTQVLTDWTTLLPK